MSDERRTFLFLQGLSSAFFHRLAAALIARGHDVHKVHLNGGDRLFWPLPGASDFRGTMAAWPGFLAATMRDRGVTDVILFGDCRPYHRPAFEIAAAAGARVHVFEEGYLRPNWVTHEIGGVNGHSSLPRDPAHYMRAAAALPEPPDPSFRPATFLQRSYDCVRYAAAQLLLWPAYPFYKSHRPAHPLVEAWGWVGKLARSRGARLRTEAALSRINWADGVFLFPLQLDSDSQIRLHSEFGGMAPAIGHVLRSFALSAPKQATLLVKAHPFDNGLVDWRSHVLNLARDLGVAGRVSWADCGDIAEFVARARGVVTINSTTGTLSLGMGVPTIVLGRAIYDMPGLTSAGPLDRFWHAPEAPDPVLWRAFTKVLAARGLLRGSFFGTEGIGVLVSSAVGRLEAGPLPVPTAAPARAVGNAQGVVSAA